MGGFQMSKETGMSGMRVTENDHEVVISCYAPGLQEHDVQIDIKQNVLTVKGRAGNTDVLQSVTLPDYVRPENVRKEIHNGYLEIRVPKQKMK